MAFAGTVLGVIFGFVLALLASKNLLFTSPYLRPIGIFSKGLIAFFRTVPDLVWAIIFVGSGWSWVFCWYTRYYGGHNRVLWAIFC